jgi:S-formylglutathione hydrolase FrmB
MKRALALFLFFPGLLLASPSPAPSRVERFTVRSAAMDREIGAWIVLPPAYPESGDTRFPVLYALHGRAAPYDTFANMPRLHQSLATRPMIIAGFDADSASFYLDSPLPAGPAGAPSLFTTFFFEEFIPAVETRHRVDPAKRMLTGFSMGGFGAFHYLLSKPEMFVSVSAMSGAFFDENPPSLPWRNRLAPLLGPPETSPARYETLAFYPRIQQLVASGVKLPPISLHCGTEDTRLIADTRNLHAFLTRLGVAHELLESPGAHDWAYWSSAIAPVLDFHWKTLPAHRAPAPLPPSP